jgi:hypothetical protein
MSKTGRVFKSFKSQPPRGQLVQSIEDCIYHTAAPLTSVPEVDQHQCHNLASKESQAPISILFHGLLNNVIVTKVIPNGAFNQGSGVFHVTRIILRSYIMVISLFRLVKLKLSEVRRDILIKVLGVM